MLVRFQRGDGRSDDYHCDHISKREWEPDPRNPDPSPDRPPDGSVDVTLDAGKDSSITGTVLQLRPGDGRVVYLMNDEGDTMYAIRAREARP